jgi:4'-phosphopantetheinyl transferase
VTAADTILDADQHQAFATSVSLPCPCRLSLPDNTVQVWVLDESVIEQACMALRHTLSSDEWQRACAFRQDKHRDRFIARRGMLRWLIGDYLNCEPGSLRFGSTQFGKPVLLHPDAAGLAFNVSHTGGMALLAFAWNCRVGVDVEQVNGGIEVAGIGLDIFSSVEEEALAVARPDSRATFLSIWTRKEALLKALGTGFSNQLKSYSTENDLRRGEGCWRASYNGETLSGWTCRDLTLGTQVRAALAVSLDDAHVSLHCMGRSHVNPRQVLSSRQDAPLRT